MTVNDSAASAFGWTRYAHFGFAVIDQFDRENSKTLVKTDLDKRKTKEGDCVKAAIGNQKTTTTKPVEVINPSPTLLFRHFRPLNLNSLLRKT
ncbi:hypothetical protein Gotur_019300 [Gossypium turneri]